MSTISSIGRRLDVQRTSAGCASKALHQPRLALDSVFSANRRQSKARCRATAFQRAKQCVTRAQAPATPQAAQPAEEEAVSVGVNVGDVVAGVRCIQCTCRERLRCEIEYGLKRGTTDNLFLVQLRGGKECVLVDVPVQEFADVFVEQLKKALKGATCSTVILTHLDPKALTTLARTIKLLKQHSGKGDITVHLTNPALQLLRDDSGELSEAMQGVECVVARPDEPLKMSDDSSFFFDPTPTPRWPDVMCVYHDASRVLFSSKLFSAHVAPPQITDVAGGWEEFRNDWRYYFNCMLAPIVKQMNVILGQLNIRVERGAAPVDGLYDLSRWWAQWFGTSAVTAKRDSSSSSSTADGAIVVTAIAPCHGPVIRACITELLGKYREWTAAQMSASLSKVAVLYASAYGNTAAIAQAISHGITKAGVAVEMVNLEQASLEEVASTIGSSQGFCIGSPTLGGHMPTQVSAALGEILRSDKARAQPCGVYGSFGWSGEAVDQLESKLKNSGFNMVFDPIRVKFRPTPGALQLCEESGTDLAQEVKRKSKKQERGVTPRVSTAGLSKKEQAMGRVVGSLCVVTARDGDAQSAMLASWISQASFDPPGLTVAVKKDRAVEPLLVLNNAFNVNILAEGREKAAMKAMLKPFKPAEDRFADVDCDVDESNGCVRLKDAAAVLQCRVANRLEAGDHWIVYATVENGEVLNDTALAVVHHRKSGTTY